MDLIKLKEVTKEYKKVKILRDVNITIEEGDIVGVIGQSGSGKTTLLNLIAGFIEPSSGEVVYYSKVDKAEKDLNENLFKLKKFIGFTPQHNSFYPQLTVEENLWHFGRMYDIRKDILQNNIDSMLHFTKLDAHRRKLAEHLSGGMQKRLDLSCSLIHKPKILILDEPTADLDPVLQEEILYLLEEVNKQGVTIVIASHHLGSVEKLCNKVAIVHDGKVPAFGLIEDVKKPFISDHFTINVHSSSKTKERIINRFKECPVKRIIDKGNKIIVYPNHVERTVSQLLNLIQEEGLQLNDMDIRHPSLNEIFERIVQE